MAKPKPTFDKRDPYQDATDKIIAALEGGTAPWQRPWELRKNGGLPSNGVTNNDYHGINVVLLALASMQNGWTDNRFATFKQGKDVGASVLKGSKGTTIYFSKPMRVQNKSSEGSGTPADDGQAKFRNFFLLRAHTVFNAAQFDNFPAAAQSAEINHEWSSHARADAIAAEYGVPIEHGGNMAYYVPSQDRIVMPERTQFSSPDDYYATLMHEIAHSTGHSDRLNRVFNTSKHSQEYAFEELIAEISSLYITSDLDLTGVTEDANVTRHAAYLGSWLEALRNDKKLIFKAAKEAEKVHGLIMSYDPVAKLTAQVSAEIDTEELDPALSLEDEPPSDGALLLSRSTAALEAIDADESSRLMNKTAHSLKPG